MKALALILALLASPAFAENCGPHDGVIAALKDQYGETVQARAIQNNGTLLELLANLETGTWTALITDDRGKSCIPASGEKFTPVKPGAPA